MRYVVSKWDLSAYNSERLSLKLLFSSPNVSCCVYQAVYAGEP